jgi:hypothetical protein
MPPLSPQFYPTAAAPAARVSLIGCQIRHSGNGVAQALGSGHHARKLGTF